MKSLIALLALAISSTVFSKEITIYSTYTSEEISSIFVPFTERTGIAVSIVSATSAELQEKIKNEKNNPIADLYLDKDISFIGQAKRNNLFQPFNSKTVLSTVPAYLRDTNNEWTLVFYRARVIMYNTDKVSPSELSTYAALGDNKWKNKLCVRTSSNSYNQSLGGYLVKHFGIEKTSNIIKSWVANFSTEPLKNDRAVIQAVADGVCDVGLANTYYLPTFIKNNPNFPVRVFFPEQQTVGTHINGVAIGITANTKKLNEANLLLEYFTSEEVQKVVSSAFSQYPVNKNVALNPTLESFGLFKEDKSDIYETTNNIDIANKIFQDIQYK